MERNDSFTENRIVKSRAREMFRKKALCSDLLIWDDARPGWELVQMIIFLRSPYPCTAHTIV